MSSSLFLIGMPFSSIMPESYNLASIISFMSLYIIFALKSSILSSSEVISFFFFSKWFCSSFLSSSSLVSFIFFSLFVPNIFDQMVAFSSCSCKRYNLLSYLRVQVHYWRALKILAIPSCSSLFSLWIYLLDLVIISLSSLSTLSRLMY